MSSIFQNVFGCLGAFAPLIGFVVSYDQLIESINNLQLKKIAKDPFVKACLCIGVSYGATGNVKYTVIACLLLTLLTNASSIPFSLNYSDLIGMTALDASTLLSSTNPNLFIDVRESIDPNYVRNRVQLITRNADLKNPCLDYKVG